MDERMKRNVSRLQNVENQLRAAGDGSYMAEVCAHLYISVNCPAIVREISHFASIPACTSIDVCLIQVPKDGSSRTVVNVRGRSAKTRRMSRIFVSPC